MNEIKELTEYRLSRAKETLEDAGILFANGKYFSAVNRIYYAMFYAVSGLLLARGLSSAKHSGVLSLFNQEFIKTGFMKKEIGKFYNEIYEFRQKADYKDFVEFEEKDVQEWLSKAGEYIPEIEKSVTISINNSR